MKGSGQRDWYDEVSVLVAHEQVVRELERSRRGGDRHHRIHPDRCLDVLVSAPRVAVIGGSLTGPATALFMQRAGFEANVYEATPKAVTLSGGVIGIEHPTLQALEDAGIGQDEIVPVNSEQIVQVRVLNRRAATSAERTLRVYPGRTTTWTLLNGALLRHLDSGSYHAGKRLKSVVADPRGPARLLFADGSETTADLVVFADGRKSFGRQLLQPQRQLRYVGYVAHRGMFRDVPPDMLDAFMSYQPERSLFNTFPAVVEGDRLRLDWTFFLDLDVPRFTRFFGDVPERRSFVFPHHITPEAVEHVNSEAEFRLPREQATIVEETSDRRAAPMMDISEPSTMVHALGASRAVLIGDALAPVRPHTGRGANNGIEQAADLTLALHQHARWNADYDAALGAWQGRHLPVVKETLRRGRVVARGLGLGLGV